ncbi:MAG: DNA-processing protein DprA [Gammaproteobacteria bacterium]
MNPDLPSTAELSAWLNLARAPGLGQDLVQASREHFGSVHAITSARGADLRQIGFTDNTIDALQQPDRQAIERDLQWLDADGRGLLTLDDPHYPTLLRRIADPPLVLYYVGSPELLALPALAIVGSRNPTASGRETATAFSRHLAGVGLCIVSGMASGIDGAAHRGALEANGHTVAVCGTGLDQIYPPAHRDLAIDIAARGLLLSEFAVGAPPRRNHFPRRNRIISGMSVGTLVIEAARKSGSLITAQQAVEQGREVFAVPGSIHNPLARGCHQLLREGAKLVESAEDIMSELGSLVTASTHTPTEQTAPTESFADDDDYRTLLNAVDFDPTSVDTLINRSGLTPDAVSSMLLILELQGRVNAVSGGRFVRAGEGKKDQ